MAHRSGSLPLTTDSQCYGAPAESKRVATRQGVNVSKVCESRRWLQVGKRHPLTTVAVDGRRSQSLVARPIALDAAGIQRDPRR